MGDVLDPTDEVGAYAVQESTCSSGSPRARKIVGRKAGLIAEAVQNVMIFKKREHAVLGYSKSSVFALAIAATAWPLWATPAFAQSESEGVGPVPASGNLVDGNEIIVTARKKEESLRDVPAAISVASGEKLEALGIREADDLEALTPGFVYRPNPGRRLLRGGDRGVSDGNGLRRSGAAAFQRHGTRRVVRCRAD
jgi:hypothetical protein